MNKHFLTLTAVAALMLSSGAAMAKVSNATEKFIEKAVIGTQFEIESSQLALERSTNPDTRAFAKQIVDDHTKAAAELDKALVAGKIDAALKPGGLDRKHLKLLEELQKEDAKDFDEEYAEAQKKVHDDAVDLFEDYAKDGDNAALQTFASSMLPTLKAHEEKAKTLESKVD